MSYRASVCCDYRPELLSDLRQTLDALQLQLMRAELSILGDRVKNVFVYTCCKGDSVNIEACQLIASTVHQALSSVLDKASSSLDYSLRTSHPSKRRRLCLIEPATYSCTHECCSCWYQPFAVSLFVLDCVQSWIIIIIINFFYFYTAGKK